DPLLVVALGREALREVFPELFRGCPGAELRLEELSPAAAGRLVGALLPDAAPADVARLVERAGGNAFFLEELAHAARAGAPRALPETALAMADGRLAELPEELRRVLRAAAVF